MGKGLMKMLMNKDEDIPDPLLGDNDDKVQYAFELLSNPTWKRDYDIFGIDERDA
ncbi:LOW QUALITY PROTEIN: hypothetical protein M8C21_015265, partial [Ambrosia artemisiifolia]